MPHCYTPYRCKDAAMKLRIAGRALGIKTAPFPLLAPFLPLRPMLSVARANSRQDRLSVPNEGDFVSWQSLGQSFQGRISQRYVSGSIKPSRTHPGLAATEKAPVVELEVYEERDGGFHPTGQRIVRPASVCHLISDLRKPTLFSGVRVNHKKEAPDELLVYADITPDGWGGVSGKSVYENLKEIPKGKALDIRINSPGGDAFEGMAIHNIINQWKKKTNSKVIAYNDGLVASAATLIAAAADEMISASPSVFMIHRAWTIAFGNRNDFQNAIEMLDRIDDQAVKMYSAWTGMDEKEMEKLVDAQTWFDADEQLSTGFASKLSENSRAAASLGTTKPWMHLPDNFKANFAKESDGKMLSRVPNIAERAEALQDAN
jgi:ATP-dependent protease ClpP protease subunit